MATYIFIALDDPLGGTQSSGQGTRAQDINDQGQIVGFYVDSSGATHGFLYSGGTYTTLDDPLGTGGTFAQGINDQGQIVGYYIDSSNTLHGFLYSGGTYVTLDDPSAGTGSPSGALGTFAFGINDSSEIVGTYVNGSSTNAAYHGFVYSGGTYTTVDDPLAADYTDARGINASGQIVGTYIGNNHIQRSFLYSNGIFTTVSNPAAENIYAFGINDVGHVVGQYQGQSFILYGGNSYAIIYDSAAYAGTFAFGINASDQVVGYFFDSNGKYHGFLASVVLPPPAATTADMILRRGSDGVYEIYNIGNNAILAGYTLGQVGTEYQFAGLGNFSGSDTTDMLLRSATTGAFEVYDISNNLITSAASLGTVGLEWQVMGFGSFGGFGETDMMLRNV